ncbi:UNVERIFIED_CONTAM: hypothetical protein NCL1_12142 [Trichonephila clavipes]
MTVEKRTWRFSNDGDSVGKLQQHGTKSVHGSCTDPPGRHRSGERCDRLVQAFSPFVTNKQPHKERSQFVPFAG